MQSKLEWKKLFSESRERKSQSIKNHRNEFDKDYDRIVYSSSVRRLQDKAQVFPLQENDFTRTRLTHSIETAAIARSLGVAIEKFLLERNEIDKESTGYLPSLLQVSAIIHDLGNPPFGHYVETIIRNWFIKWFESKEFQEILGNTPNELRLNDDEKLDFMNFEGNAQTIRILTKLQMLNDQYGANFTYATLATIMKYPWGANDALAKEKKKFGYFKSEESIIKNIWNKTGLNNGIRHPATFILEAADDITYLCADIEDGVKKGIIPWEQEYERMKRDLNRRNYVMEDIFKRLDCQNNKNIDAEIPDEILASIQNFKVTIQGVLFEHVVKAFKDNYDDIITGNYGNKALIENCGLDDLVKSLKKLAQKYCFNNKEVITLELVGDRVITGLLDIFVDSLITLSSEPGLNTREGKIYSIISPNFKYIFLWDYDNNKPKQFKDARMYDKLLLITDFISGMTDSYAVNLYKELLGVKLP